MLAVAVLGNQSTAGSSMDGDGRLRMRLGSSKKDTACQVCHNGWIARDGADNTLLNGIATCLVSGELRQLIQCIGLDDGYP